LTQLHHQEHLKRWRIFELEDYQKLLEELQDKQVKLDWERNSTLK
jgi:hypothetical protein